MAVHVANHSVLHEVCIAPKIVEIFLPVDGSRLHFNNYCSLTV